MNRQKIVGQWWNLFHADGFGWASLNACLALSALFFIYYCDLFVVKGDGFFWALFDAGSTAYAFLSVNNCRHY
jgi:hypothetical protein